MHLDVMDLQAFYYRTPLGRWTQRRLQRGVRELWPDVGGCRMEGFGFAAPFLRPFLGEAERVMSLMPAEQGVMHWPPGAANLSALVEETQWPIEQESVDRLLIAHGLETCERPNALLEEIWRVLAPQGRVIFLVPNRTGAWARRDVTPFGYGRPYSLGQLERLLRNHRFAPGRHSGALFAPPSYGETWRKLAGGIERFGAQLSPQRFAGVLIVEATKMTDPMPKRVPETARTAFGVLGELTQPVPKPTAGIRGFGPVAPPNKAFERQ